ncbi:MAG: bifunctional nicotinamidase/pyrazinamidase [Planctomycetia bacterium]|nr:bifunctional nicotinamidase/pyrazinamidase [Planctomycetia bacterium]
MPKRALAIVDVQNDFLPGGALAVPGSGEIISVINRVQPLFELVVATLDWHPRDHVSFAVNHPGRVPGDVITVDGQSQVLWPVHCVQATAGAALADELAAGRIARVFHKGTDPRLDSYSAFFDNAHRRGTGLGDYLKAAGVRELFLAGLTTEYCVAHSARDALWLGFQVTVIQDACRGIELHSGDVAAAIENMRAAGVRLVNSDELT